MKRPRYDANPDVDEALHYSGAGAAAVARKDAELKARLEAATREVNARAQAEWNAREREDRRSTVRFFVGILLVMVAMVGMLLWGMRT